MPNARFMNFICCIHASQLLMHLKMRQNESISMHHQGKFKAIFLLVFYYFSSIFYFILLKHFYENQFVFPVERDVIGGFQ
jgi:hypothetical protein